MPRCYISLGGNLGAVGEAFDTALDRLGTAPGNSLIAVSSVHRTIPVGDRSGDAFLNAAAEIETLSSPLALLDLLQSIEVDLGRTKTFRWAPRPIDLDLLFYGSESIDLPRLTVPHPAAWYRRFVLDPLVEIAPRFVHPVKKADIETLRRRLLGRPLVVALAGGESEARSALILGLGPELPDVRFVDRDEISRSGVGPVDEPALTFWLGSDGNPTATHSRDFCQLPLLSRIDATKVSEPVQDFVRHVIQSASG
jgi:2-amino-4-hydroxy-6-hydroxymethyldihydropteridine diphosphokinase